MRQILRTMTLIVLLCLLVACAQATIAPATLTLQVITVVVTATPEPSAMPTVTTTATSTALPTSTRLPTKTPGPTFTPYPTSTPFELTNPRPSNDEILGLIFNKHEQSEDAQEIGIQRFYSNISRQDIDVNGDGQLDILMTGTTYSRLVFLDVMSFEQGAWHEMFYLEEHGHYCGYIKTSVTASAIIADVLTCSGGTGISNQSWVHHWISCKRDQCSDVWSAPLLFAETELGPSYRMREIVVVGNLSQPDKQTIELVTRRFEIQQQVSSPDIESGEEGPALAMRRISGPDKRQIYQCNGVSYVLVQSEQSATGIEISREFDAQTEETDQFLRWDLINERFKTTIYNGGFVQTELDWSKIADAYSEFWGMPYPNETKN
ncbi:MAG: hypothetical protein HZB51_27805 [Chloroflexi bacterium]|nr:hypothetical protein [Chloroflexota bacterium]